MNVKNNFGYQVMLASQKNEKNCTHIRTPNGSTIHVCTNKDYLGKEVDSEGIPYKLITKFKSDVMDGNPDARRKFYQRLGKYAPALPLEDVHQWKRDQVERCARSLHRDMLYYKIDHEMVDYTMTVRMANVVRFLKEYDYIE